MIIKRLPKNEWNQLRRYRNYVKRCNAVTCVLNTNSDICCDEQDWLELKFEACHNGGWSTDLDEPVNQEYKQRQVYKKKMEGKLDV